MNMKKKSFWRQGILALCLACMCFACGGGEKKAPLGPSKGLPGELLLIVDASLWKTSARDSLEDVLKGSVPGLSQHEPMFRMIRIFPENYSGQYSTMRNIIEVREDPQADGVEMGVAYNVKAADLCEHQGAGRSFAQPFSDDPSGADNRFVPCFGNAVGSSAFEEKVQQDCGRRVAGTFRLYGEGAGRYR